VLPNHLTRIAHSLEADVNQRVGAGKCLLEPTQEGTGHHFAVTGGRPRVIAWVGLRARGVMTDKPMRPCVVVGIRGDLLSKVGAVAGGLEWKPNANYKKQQQGGHGEWHGIAYSLGDDGYGAILQGLVAAVLESVRRGP